jgi:hypothetical protein
MHHDARRVERGRVQLPGPFRLAGPALIGPALLLERCASPRPRIADETNVEA